MDLVVTQVQRLTASTEHGRVGDLVYGLLPLSSVLKIQYKQGLDAAPTLTPFLNLLATDFFFFKF